MVVLGNAHGCAGQGRGAHEGQDRGGTGELIARRSGLSDGAYPEASSPPCRSLAERIVESAAAIHAAEGALVGLLAEFHEAKGWMGDGYRSLEHWMSVNCGFTLGEARARAALSDRIGELPLLLGALDGALSVGSARSAAKVATAELDEAVTEIATMSTAAQAARAFAAFARAEEPEAPRDRCPGDVLPEDTGSERPADERGAATWWRQWYDDHGYLRTDGRFDPTTGAELAAAVEAMLAAMRADAAIGTDAEGRSATVSRVDAVGELAATAMTALRAGGATGPGGERFSVHVTVDAAVLAGLAPGAGVLEWGQRVDAEVVRSWLAAAGLDVMIHDEGRPLWLGRSRRVASAAQRRALRVRDGGCAFPGCGHTRYVDAHHVLPWEEGGLTDIDKLVLLCRRHHRLLHAGGYRIEMLEGRPVFIHLDRGPVALRRPGCCDQLPPELLPPPSHPQRARRSGETLTTWGLGVFVGHLLGVGRR